MDTETITIIADPNEDGFGFYGPDDGCYGAPTLDEAIILAEQLFPSATITVEGR
jgi:hypothetical protein